MIDDLNELIVPTTPRTRDFRLDPDIRPLAYTATLTLDPEARTLHGTMRIDLELAAPTRELTLHAIDLEVDDVQVEGGGTRQTASASDCDPASETVQFVFKTPLPAGRASCSLRWHGRFSPGLRGLYTAGPLAVTQFEAADARRVFPCFDEPAFKARWELTLEVAGQHAVLSNAAVSERHDLGERLRIRFASTPRLPTYLIALVCGPLVASETVMVRGVPVRTLALADKIHLSGFAQEVAAAVLPRLEDYFGLPYAFGKLDQVAVPNFEAGAMENAGLVTYREITLLLDPRTASLVLQKRVAEVITHELAHQWFGNWVTMQWWDDLWLNEAFATWMAYKVVDAWRPHWRMWLDFDLGKAHALQLDALESTHPIRAEVKNADQAGENFDAITYDKGGAVLRMIEGWLGAAPFCEGIRAYMRRHGEANATAADLWQALAEASGQPVLELASAWIGQAGYPLLEVARSSAGLRVAQRRFFSAPGVDPGESRWPVPLVVRWADGSGENTTRVLLRGAREEVTLPAQGELAWLFANAGATGFYRVAYEDGLLDRLGDHLDALAPPERIALLSDEWALVRAGLGPIDRFLDLLARFSAEQDWAVLDEVVGRLAFVEHRLVGDPDRPGLARLVARTFGTAQAKLGWEAASGETDEVRLLRASLLRATALVARVPALVAEARARLDRFLSGELGALEPNLHDVSVASAARAGDAALFDRLQARYGVETDPAFRRRYLLALAQFEDPALAERAQALVLAGAVPLQDLPGFVYSLLANRGGREAFWRELRQHWPKILGLTEGAPTMLRRVVESLANLPERRHFEEVSELLAAHPLEATRQTVAQTLERLRLEIELRERAQPAIHDWVNRAR
jgi:puromycin-sensitive aminopeptidase